MKKTLNILLALVLSGSWASCSDSLDRDMNTDIGVIVDGKTVNGDVIEVKTNTPVTFTFSDNPDYVSFYSGENGYDYTKRFETELPVDQINSELQLYAWVRYGKNASIKNSLRIFIATDYAGLTKNNDKDKVNLAEYPNWREITDDCNLPTSDNKTSAPVSISLNQYLGQDIVFAFWYCPHDITDTQPKWKIYDFKIVNTDKKTGEKSSFYAGSMGFIPFDEKVSGSGAYKYEMSSTDKPGTWNLISMNRRPISELDMHSTSANAAALNSDWLVSSPLKANSRTPDKGIAVKNLSDRTEDYQYTYNKAGEYTATFIVTNGNVEYESKMIKEFKIKVID